MPSPPAAPLSFTPDEIAAICLQAHAVILPYWRQQKDLGVETKDDDSPVTLADKAANHAIVSALSRLTPNTPIVSEEGDQPSQPAKGRFWLVDPLDGTKGFIRGSDEFTVNIALIEDNYPIFGMLGVPARHTLYVGDVTHGAQYCTAESLDAMLDWQPIATAATPRNQPQRILASRAHATPKIDEWITDEGIQTQQRIPANSALKFALIAEGSADLYPRFGPTMEWDSAAGQAIIEAAGGEVLNLKGERFVYGKKNYLNGGFIAWGSQPL